MNKDYLLRVLVAIVICLLVYLAIKPSGDKKYLELLKNENAKIVKQLEANQILINERLDSIKVIEKKETIIKNYYNEIINSVDSITNDSGAVAVIRLQLHKLGTARLN